MKYVVSLLILFIALSSTVIKSDAQVDKEFWFAAPNVHDGSGAPSYKYGFDTPIVIRVSTFALPATVKVSMPANPAFKPISATISPNSTYTFQLTNWKSLIVSSPPGTVLNNGLLIQSTSNITAYYEVVSYSDDCQGCNPEIFSLKGKNSLGNEFYISSQYTFDIDSVRWTTGPTTSFDIVATRNSTHVTVIPSKDIVGYNAGQSFNLVLDSGQTYSAQGLYRSASQHLQGSYVKSDKPIAITLKDDLVLDANGGCADLIGDQTVPTNVIGNEYIVTRGYLNPNDLIVILAPQANTNIYINGSTTPSYTISKPGDSWTYTMTENSTYIRADKNIYVYHITGNGCELGSAIIPRLTCTGSKSVSVVRSSTDQFSVMVTTKNGNQGYFTANGASGQIQASDFSAVPGTNGNYVSARVDLSGFAVQGMPLNISNSKGTFSLGFINGSPIGGCRYAYFSDFNSDNLSPTLLNNPCADSTIQLTANNIPGATYSWSGPNFTPPSVYNPTISHATSANSGEYYVTATIPGCGTAQDSIAVLIDSPFLSIAPYNACGADSINLTALTTGSKNIVPSYWTDAGHTHPVPNPQDVTQNGTYYVTGVSPTGCTATDSVVIKLGLNLTPKVNISATKDTICANTPVTFTATPVNGGTSPVYQWQLNGSNVGTNSSKYTNSTPKNGDIVTCALTSSLNCVTTPTASSNSITITVTPVVTPSVTIAASANNICAGTPVTFTVTPANGGATPVYQWLLNGANVGTNSNTYTNSALTNGDIVTCTVTSSLNCVTNPTASSNSITMAVTPLVLPSLVIAAQTNSVCAGTPVTLTATAVNGGPKPVYQWQLNGSNVGTNSGTYTNSAPNNGDVISCTITSSLSCVSSRTVSSNTITINVTQMVTPTLSISASPNTVCAGSPVTYTATAVNGGAYPSFQWTLNGSNVGTNAPTYTNSNPNNGDAVTCTVTSNANCLTTLTATAAGPTVTVSTPVTPSVSVTASANNICVGNPVTFTAAGVNAGASPTYQWQVNGANVGSNSNTYMYTTPTNGDEVGCMLTNNDGCVSGNPATSNTVVMVIYPLPMVSVGNYTVIHVGDNAILHGTATGSIQTIVWQPWPTQFYNSDTLTPIVSPLKTTTYTLVVTTTNNCTASNTVTVKVLPKNIIIPNVFSPNGDAINDTWQIQNINQFATCTVQVFNRYGQPVYSSVGYNTPWDGTYNGKPLPVAAYYYIINLNDGSPVKAGTVMIVR